MGCQMVVKWLSNGALCEHAGGAAPAACGSLTAWPRHPSIRGLRQARRFPMAESVRAGSNCWITELHTRATPRARTAKMHRGRRRTIVSLRVRCQKNKRPSGGNDGIDFQPPAPPSSMLTANVLSALNKNGRLFFWSKQPHIAKGRQH